MDQVRQDMDNSEYAGFLAARRSRILQTIAQAAAASGRDASTVRALAVSKTVEPEAVELAWRAGWRFFAENRPQELARKLAYAQERPLLQDASFDLIGNLQKNKINQVVGRVGLIHSIASEPLARAVSERCVRAGVVQPVLLEVNVSGEQSKSGFSPDEARACAEALAGLPGIELYGLMTMAPKGEPDVARRTFAGLRELACDLRLRTGLPLSELSCGMSDDFAIAVEEGATIVRLGRVAFDPGYPAG